MVEERPWVDPERQAAQLYEKVNTYLTFVDTGELVRMHPDAAGKQVSFNLDCFMSPSGQIQGLIDRITPVLAKLGIEFKIELYGPDFAPHAAVAVMADF